MRGVMCRVMSALVFAAAVGAATAAVGADPVPCAVPVGARVMLRASDFDPDVFVWDAKSRVIDYTAGVWRGVEDVLKHALLAKGGTEAIVVACDGGVVHAKYSGGNGDAVGLKLTTGPNHGRYGWVTSSDIHPQPVNQASK
jgi:hypothetical protein